ncbi:MAG TPA: hypothetical protein VN181_04975, partial [Thermoanaerobaculia bacterium]|nr:hypothetical protein [Thermoanaerobaculia bacterium]
MKHLLLLLAIAADARAATILIAPDSVVIGESRAIVVATAESARSRWSASGWIETVTTMRVDESIKGSLRAGATFELVTLGGIVDHIGMHVSGTPHFVNGERAILL